MTRTPFYLRFIIILSYLQISSTVVQVDSSLYSFYRKYLCIHFSKYFYTIKCCVLCLYVAALRHCEIEIVASNIDSSFKMNTARHAKFNRNPSLASCHIRYTVRAMPIRLQKKQHETTGWQHCMRGN